jgi:AraC family transcriptional regulator of adaptative response/methylated-DNA-[protein]-cysteine methyltransferase
MESIRLIDNQMSEDYRRIEQAIHFLENHYAEQPSLGELAASAHLSEYHFQRLFSRWVGISPKRFMQYLTKEHAKQLLQHSGRLLETSFTAGLSGPGRLHDLFVTWEAVTPGQYKARGQGLRIAYGFHASPFGDCLLAVTERGICALVFVAEDDRATALQQLHHDWPEAEIDQDTSLTQPVMDQVTDLIQGRTNASIRLHLSGTNFQLKVWEALLRIPEGTLVTYEDIAVYIGLPKATRAVGSAVGHNPIPVIIPCHRAIRKSGDIGGYRWGTARKLALVGWEAARMEKTEIGGLVTA